MRILLSAYACEPNKGSEPGVGWNWTQALVRQGHTVHLITRSNNRGPIEAGLSREELRPQVTYYDLPGWCRSWKHWAGGIYLYYFLWQIGAYRRAVALHSELKFDRVQHITFALFRQPSFMGRLGIPFVFGPVGGGEEMPHIFRKALPLSGKLREIFRDIANKLTSYDPLMLSTFSRASLIACTTSDTLKKIPIRFHKKCIVLPTIGIDESSIAAASLAPDREPRFLFVGRLIYWKGLHLALRALAQVRLSVPRASLKVVGDGDDASWLKKIASDNGVADAVEWVPSMPHDDILEEYTSNVAFVFPSLHDSGGMVVLEALASGLPVICLNLGGPGVLVTPSCGILVDAHQKDEEMVVADLAQAMMLLATDVEARTSLSANTVSRACELTWDRAARIVHSSPCLERQP